MWDGRPNAGNGPALIFVPSLPLSAILYLATSYHMFLYRLFPICIWLPSALECTLEKCKYILSCFCLQKLFILCAYHIIDSIIYDIILSYTLITVPFGLVLLDTSIESKRYCKYLNFSKISRFSFFVLCKQILNVL